MKPPLSFPQVVAPVSRESKLETMMKQYLEGLKKNNKEIHENMDKMYNDLNKKYESIATNVSRLNVQVAQKMEAVKKQAKEKVNKVCNVFYTKEDELLPIPKPPHKDFNLGTRT